MDRLISFTAIRHASFSFPTSADVSRALQSRQRSAAVCLGLARPFPKEWTMAGQELVVPRARGAQTVMPDGPALHRPGRVITSAGRTGGGARRVPESLLTRTDQPIVPGLIALVAALAFGLARWQTWAQG